MSANQAATNDSAADQSSSRDPVSLETVVRLADLITELHILIYFCAEGPEEFEKVGLKGWSGYFASRTAAMGQLPTEMVIATFYNFSARRVSRAMDGVWENVSAEQAQAARWAAVGRVLSEARQAVSANEMTEATELLQQTVDGLSWAGRPMAAGNHAVLDSCPDDPLVRLWQLVTILREWRGDTHIGLLIAEPLSGVECSIVSCALEGHTGFIKATRGHSDEAWNAALESLVDRGLVASEVALTDAGKSWRDDLELRTNERCVEIWAGHDDATVNRLGDLLDKLVAAVPEGARRP